MRDEPQLALSCSCALCVLRSLVILSSSGIVACSLSLLGRSAARMALCRFSAAWRSLALCSAARLLRWRACIGHASVGAVSSTRAMLSSAALLSSALCCCFARLCSAQPCARGSSRSMERGRGGEGAATRTAGRRRDETSRSAERCKA